MNVENGQIIGNIGLLDIRHAEPESVEAIDRIGNVGTVLYSRTTAPLLTKLNIGNIGSTLEVPDGAQLVSGQLTINRAYFDHQDAPLDLMLAGQMIIEPDVPADSLMQGLGSLYVAGLVICPEPLVGALQAKIKDLSGQMIAYAGDAKIVMGKLKLDDAYLRGLADGTTLLAFGKVDALDVLDDDLLQAKIHELQVFGKLRCLEANTEILQAKLTGDGVRTTIIPSGYHVIDRSVILDTIRLGALPSRNLYVTGRVEIAPDVTPELLNAQLDGLKSEDMIVAPKSLNAALVEKVDLFNDRVLFYEGKLWSIDGEETLRPQRFDYLEGKLTLLVTGELTIDPAVEPALLAENVGQIANFGAIRCTPGQMSAVQARLNIDEGELIDSTEEDLDDLSIGNVGHLTL